MNDRKIELLNAAKLRYLSNIKQAEAELEVYLEGSIILDKKINISEEIDKLVIKITDNKNMLETLVSKYKISSET